MADHQSCIQVVFANAAQDAVTHYYNYAESETGNEVAHTQTGPGGTAVTIERDEDAAITGYEIKFPAASLGKDQYQAGDLIAVGVCVNDGDQEVGQEGLSQWTRFIPDHV
jgi:hypothetical protein